LKFLIIGRDVDYGGPMSPADLLVLFENVYMPSFEMLKKWEQDKKVVGGFLAAQRAGAIIIEAPSAEELSSWMTSLPFWGRQAWEVIPLQTFQSGIDDLKRQTDNVKKMILMTEKSQQQPLP
jgi:hypothetical protein